MAIQNLGTRIDSEVRIKVGNLHECWKTLAALVAERARSIYQWRGESGGSEIWELARRQVEKPLCCGILKLSQGWLISFDAAQLGNGEIEVCVEPHRLILLGRRPSTGGTGPQESVVRILKLPNEVDLQPVTTACNGRIVDIELHNAIARPSDYRAVQAA